MATYVKVTNIYICNWNYTSNWVYVVLSHVKQRKGLYLRTKLNSNITRYAKPNLLKRMMQKFKTKELDYPDSHKLFPQPIAISSLLFLRCSFTTRSSTSKTWIRCEPINGQMTTTLQQNQLHHTRVKHNYPLEVCKRTLHNTTQLRLNSNLLSLNTLSSWPKWKSQSQALTSPPSIFLQKED